MGIKVFWTPAGINLNTIGDNRFIDLSDGDTPNIRMSIRMLSIDTPEKAATAGIRDLDKLDDAFNGLAAWMQTGNAPVTADLAAHLVPRLARAQPAHAHVAQGKAATEAHDALIAQFLKKPNGRMRNLFVRIADEPFDQYGRLLAYVAPDYTPEERASMTRAERATFNLRMIENGHAAPFVIYPSVPGELDYPIFVAAAEAAIAAKKGIWADPLVLLAYEFRAMERLAGLKQKLDKGTKVSKTELFGFIERYCADISTGTFTAPQGYVGIAPQHRLFLWQRDVRQAVADLNLTPATPFFAIGDS